MKKVPLKELKESLARYLGAVASGTPLEVTKHLKPYVTIFPARLHDFYIGKHAGKRSLTPLEGLPRSFGSGVLKSLEADRSE